MSGNALPVAGPAQVKRYARDLFRRHPRALAVAIGLHVLAAIAGLVGPRLLGDIVEAIQQDRAAGVVDRLAVTIAAFIVVQAVLVRFAVLASARLGELVLARLREDFVDRVLASHCPPWSGPAPVICSPGPRGTWTRSPRRFGSRHPRR